MVTLQCIHPSVEFVSFVMAKTFSSPNYITSIRGALFLRTIPFLTLKLHILFGWEVQRVLLQSVMLNRILPM